MQSVTIEKTKLQVPPANPHGLAKTSARVATSYAKSGHCSRPGRVWRISFCGKGEIERTVGGLAVAE
jgi:hypothetical protein